MTNAIPCERGCGRRVKGGVYAECGFSADGLPLEHFIIDPPIAVDPNALGLSPIGVTLLKRDSATHIFDWIGSEHYPNVADFIEEVRRFGLSRRLSKTLDYSSLTRASRIVLLHSRGYIHNHGQYKMTEPEGARGCPRLAAMGRPGEADIHPPAEMCARFWWQDVVPAGHGYGTMKASEFATDARQITRRMPSFEYDGWKAHAGVKPEYALAIVLSLPVQRFVVIRDPDEHSHGETAQRIASATAIPVEVEEE